MTEARREIIDLLLEAKALRFGTFTLKSGARSPFFFNLGDVARGPHLARLGELLAQAVQQHWPDATVLFGPAYKGIAMVTVAAAAAAREGRELSICYDRKEAKAHGEGGSVVGHRVGDDDRVVMIDDVITSGLTKVQAIEKLDASFGIKPVGILVTVDRRVKGEASAELAGLPLKALVTLPDIVTHLREAGDDRAELLDRFYEGQPWE